MKHITVRVIAASLHNLGRVRERGREGGGRKGEGREGGGRKGEGGREGEGREGGREEGKGKREGGKAVCKSFLRLYLTRKSKNC